MSQYGDICRLCGAGGDYCGLSFGAGFRCDIDCRLIADVLTAEQASRIREDYESQREIQASALRGLRTLEDELGFCDYDD